MNNLEQLMKIVDEIEEVGSKLNTVKSELRQKDFDLKVRKSALEFSPDFADFREGLKVKEIPPKILEETEEECREIITLKEERDNLEHKLTVLKLKFQCLKEVIDSEKITSI